MSRATTRSRGGRNTPPAFVVPAAMDRKTKRKVQDLIDAQLREASGKPPPEIRPFRFRFQLMPLAWLAAAAVGLACHHGHAFLAAALAAVLTALVTVGVTRHRRPFPRMHNQGQAAWAGAWMIILALAGLGPWAAAWLAGWAVPYGFWLHHYQWRPAAPAAAVVPEVTTEDIWAKLAARQKWQARLGVPRQIPGGAQYPILCNGAETHIGQITAKRDEVAAAFDKAITEAYTEPDPSGIKSRGILTILRRGTLDTPRRWDGASINPATGLALVGRFPEGGEVHQRYFLPGPGGGARHTIIAGCDGSGKTGLLDLSLAISATSGLIAPVILDPQEGQALPAWRDVVPYACGADECMTYLRGLHAAMFDRSAYLSTLRWCKDHGIATGRCTAGRCKIRKGMGWFDPIITGLPIIEITVDEAPVLLALKGAAALLLDIAKLGRKVGFRLVLAAQVPSIAEMGKSELRSILNGGNVFCFRTGDKVTSGMAGIPANPNELPLVWSDGLTPTVGLGFAKTVDGRPGVTMRTDWLEDPYEVAETTRIRGMDELVADRLAASITATGEVLAGLQQQAADAAGVQLQLLGMLGGQPMTMGQLISQSDLTVSVVVDAVTTMINDGRVAQAGDLLARAQ